MPTIKIQSRTTTLRLRPTIPTLKLKVSAGVKGDKGDPGTSVPSVFGRVGAILAQADDYTADQIDNDSSVTGDTVKDALEYLAANGGSVDSVNGQTGTVVLDPDDLDDSGTTNKFTDAADIAKLAAIEALADVTDAGNVGAAINGASSKSTPADADKLGLLDSASSFALKYLTWANVKATLKTYFDTLYQAAGSYAASGANTDITSLAGIINGGDAAAGKIGEFMTNSASGVSLVNTTPKTVVSLTLTAGDWDVWGRLSVGTGSGMTAVDASLSLTDNTEDFTYMFSQDFTGGTGYPAGRTERFTPPHMRVNVTSSTPVYLVAKCDFSGSVSASASIFARRMR